MYKVLCVSLSVALVSSLAACSDEAVPVKANLGNADSGEGPGDGGSGSDGQLPPTTDGASPEADSGKPADDGGSSLADSGPSIANCTTYCTDVTANCTAANEQYPSMGACMAFCSSMPQGKPGDTSGDSVECRAYHSGAPAKATPATHCSHGGPTGGDNIVSDLTPGVCGEGCEAFCNMAQATCTGMNQQWAHTVDCLAACKTFKPTAGSYSTSDTSKNDFGCRVYHLSVAASGSAGAATHCPHIIANSATCTQ